MTLSETASSRSIYGVSCQTVQHIRQYTDFALAKYEFKSFRKSATRQDSTPRINPPSSSSVSKLSLLHIASSADRSAAVAALLGPSRSAANRISPSPSPSVQSNKAKPESSTVPPPVPQKTPAQLNQPPSASALPSLVTEATPVPYSSQPVPTQSQPQAPGQLGGVWNDLQSLQPKTIDATLPLQIASFQQPSAQPLVTPYSTIQPLLSTQNAFGNLSNSPGASFPSALSHNTAVSAGTVGRSVSLGSGLNATQPSSSYQGGLSPFQASPLASSTSLTPVSGTPSPNPFAPQALPYVGATPTGYGGISGLSHSPESSFPASPSPYAGQQPIPPQQQSSHLFQQPSQVQTPMFQPQHQPQPQFLHPQLQVPNGMNAYMQIQSPGTPFMTAQPYGSTPSPFPQTQSYSQVPPQMQQQQQGQGFAGASQFTSWVQQPPSQQQWGM